MDCWLNHQTNSPKVQRGEVDIMWLIVEQVLSRNIDEYAVDALAALAARN